MLVISGKIVSDPRMSDNLLHGDAFLLLHAHHPSEEVVQIGGDIFDSAPFLQQLGDLLIFDILERNVFVNRLIVRRSTNDHHKETDAERPNVRLIRHKLLLLRVHFGRFIVRLAHIFRAQKARVLRQIKELCQPKVD